MPEGAQIAKSESHQRAERRFEESLRVWAARQGYRQSAVDAALELRRKGVRLDPTSYRDVVGALHRYGQLRAQEQRDIQKHIVEALEERVAECAEPVGVVDVYCSRCHGLLTSTALTSGSLYCPKCGRFESA